MEKRFFRSDSDKSSKNLFISKGKKKKKRKKKHKEKSIQSQKVIPKVS